MKNLPRQHEKLPFIDKKEKCETDFVKFHWTKFLFTSLLSAIYLLSRQGEIYIDSSESPCLI